MARRETEEENWTPEQLAHARELRAGLPRRPYWIVVRNPAAPKDCGAIDGFMQLHWHTAWRNCMTPCGLVACCCTVWALTDAEARAHRRRTPPSDRRS